MEVIQTNDNYIVRDGEHSLWCNRYDGSMASRNSMELANAWNPVCLGIVYGLVGKLSPISDSDATVILVSKRKVIGTLSNGQEIHRIEKIALIPLSVHQLPVDLSLDPCPYHHCGLTGRTDKLTVANDTSHQKLMSKTWAQMKEQIKFKKRDTLLRERRITEEICRMFDGSDSFYFTPSGDLTNTLQRKLCDHPGGIDDRFFWNKHMLSDLSKSEDSHWFVPVVQGFMQVNRVLLRLEGLAEPQEVVLGLLSRRSRHRAGTRFRMRGADKVGNVANFVETEQFISSIGHTVSLVLVRGSVPVYWSQVPTKYRPAIRVERGGDPPVNEVFANHMNGLTELYGKVAIANLCDRRGRERILVNEFTERILDFDSPNLTYILFDFHQYCKGMHFENVEVLIESVADVIKEHLYCWADGNGVICKQRGVFRVNCVDCLDRTNVVQSQIAKTVLETQMRRLGLLTPEAPLSDALRALWNGMWADNGDALSQQYAGTGALKGDFTRTGERNLAGVVRDGVNSANRFYVNRFRDLYRQTAISLLQGEEVPDAQLIAEEPLEGPFSRVTEPLRRIAFSHQEVCYGVWLAVDVDSLEDVVLLLSSGSYYVAAYRERPVPYTRVALDRIDSIAIGREPPSLRLYHHHDRDDDEGGLRWNTVAPVATPPASAAQQCQSIVETFAMSSATNSLGLRLKEEPRLERLANPSEGQPPRGFFDVDDFPAKSSGQLKASRGYLKSFPGRLKASMQRKKESDGKPPAVVYPSLFETESTAEDFSSGEDSDVSYDPLDCSRSTSDFEALSMSSLLRPVSPLGGATETERRPPDDDDDVVLPVCGLLMVAASGRSLTLPATRRSPLAHSQGRSASLTGVHSGLLDESVLSLRSVVPEAEPPRIPKSATCSQISDSAMKEASSGVRASPRPTRAASTGLFKNVDSRKEFQRFKNFFKIAPNSNEDSRVKRGDVTRSRDVTDPNRLANIFQLNNPLKQRTRDARAVLQLEKRLMSRHCQSRFIQL